MAQLATPEELFETAFAEAPIGIALVGLDGTWLKVNRALCELVGYPEPELLTLTFQDITHPDDVDADLALARQLEAGEIPSYQMEKRYITRTGEVIWVHLSVSLVRDREDRPRHFISHIQDISPRKRDEEALRRDRRALDEAQQIAHVGSWSWEPATARTSWTAEMYRIFGRDPQLGPALGEDFFAYLHPDDRERIVDGYGHAFGAGETFELDYRIIRGDGKQRNVRALGRRDPDHPGWYVGTVQDVTQLRQAELAAIDEREHSETIIAAMDEGYALSTDGRLATVNDAFCRITGFSREELVGAEAPFPFWAPESRQETLVLREKLLSERGGTIEVKLMRKSGERFDARLTARPARSAEGEFLGFVSTLTDISQQKRHQEELERLAMRDPLTNLLNHRTLHEQLRAEVARAARYGYPLSLVLLDFDHFKRINDQHGHLVGDDVLRAGAWRLNALVREGEHLGRVGGEELAWILPHAELDGARVAAERAREAAGRMSLPDGSHVTLSAGVAELSLLLDGVPHAAGGGERLADRLYGEADKALYEAKRQGRNRAAIAGGPTELN